MEKNQNSGKVKLLLFMAVAIIVLLLIISIVQVININIQNDKIRKQQLEIERLYEQHEYYESLKDADGSHNLEEAK